MERARSAVKLFRKGSIGFDDYFDKYYETIKEDYPQYSKQQIKEVCLCNFAALRASMEQGDLYDYRMTGMGLFCIFPGTARKIKADVRKGLEKGRIDLPLAEYYAENIQRVLKKEKDVE